MRNPCQSSPMVVHSEVLLYQNMYMGLGVHGSWSSKYPVSVIEKLIGSTWVMLCINIP